MSYNHIYGQAALSTSYVGQVRGRITFNQAFICVPLIWYALRASLLLVYFDQIFDFLPLNAVDNSLLAPGLYKEAMLNKMSRSIKFQRFSMPFCLVITVLEFLLSSFSDRLC